MQKVYSNAKSVLVWLGDANKENELVYDLIGWLALKFDKGVQGVDLIDEVEKTCSGDEGLMGIGHKHFEALDGLLKCLLVPSIMDYPGDYLGTESLDVVWITLS